MCSKTAVSGKLQHHTGDIRGSRSHVEPKDKFSFGVFTVPSNTLLAQATWNVLSAKTKVLLGKHRMDTRWCLILRFILPDCNPQQHGGPVCVCPFMCSLRVLEVQTNPLRTKLVCFGRALSPWLWLTPDISGTKARTQGPLPGCAFSVSYTTTAGKHGTRPCFLSHHGYQPAAPITIQLLAFTLFHKFLFS